MCKILLSIKPEYVERIMDGSKIYEFRKRKCSKDINGIIIYSTAPVKKWLQKLRFPAYWKELRNRYGKIQKASQASAHAFSFNTTQGKTGLLHISYPT